MFKTESLIMSPLLSVVIPTHNRAKYAIHAIRSILSLKDARLELVISDTSTDNVLADQVSSGVFSAVSETRFKYFRPTERLDMTANHNAAISQASGQFVCLIGDDDTITADALRAANWAAENNIEVIAPNIVANYAWPDFRSRFFGAGHAARLYLPKKLGAVSLHACADAIERALQGAAQGTDGLPKIYHGIVSRALLERIKERSGAYFHGSSPDVSGAIGLALVSKEFMVVDYPLTIPGASGGSNTGRSAMNKHKGGLGQESQTKGFQESGWSEGVPRFFSVETVWAHAALETIRRLEPARVRDFNFSRLLGICSALHSDYSKEIEQVIPEVLELSHLSKRALSAEIKHEKHQYQLKRLMRLVKRFFHPTASGGRAFKAGIDTIEATPDVLARYMFKQGWNWDEYLSQNGCKAIAKSHSL
jgi:Glycosyl transferase family 2